MKYNKNFERDYNWYLKHKDDFTFDGQSDTELKVISDPEGRDAKYCFFKYDSNGKIIPTKEPELLFQIFKCKGSINFNIKMWAEDRASGLLPKSIFDEMVKELDLLDWMVDAVENQKYLFYKKYFP